MVGVGSWLNPFIWLYQHEWFLVIRVRGQEDCDANSAGKDAGWTKEDCEKYNVMIDFTRMWKADLEGEWATFKWCDEAHKEGMSGPGKGDSPFIHKLADAVIDVLKKQIGS